MVMGLQGMGSASEMQQMRAHMQQMQKFHSGETNLSMEDLMQMQQNAPSDAPKEANEALSTIIDSFDKIDTNGDGISIDEMTTFAESTGLHLGPPPGMMMGEGPHQGRGPGGPGGKGGHGGPPPVESSSDEDEESYIDKLLESYSSYETDYSSLTTLSYSA